jgi:opacity protein-like surface antigen
MDSDILITPNSSFRNPNTFPDAPATGADTGAYSKAWGGTVGAGIEHALTPAWSIGLEYDYYRFASHSGYSQFHRGRDPDIRRGCGQHS